MDPAICEQRVTPAFIRDKKGRQRITFVTAYDFPTAKLADEGKRQPRALLTNSGRLGGVARVAGELGSDIPGEKLVDLIDRVLGDA